MRLKDRVVSVREIRMVKTPNDLKLSEPRGWRDRCVVGARRRPEAAGVTAARVRCSAWLGVSGFIGKCASTKIALVAAVVEATKHGECPRLQDVTKWWR